MINRKLNKGIKNRPRRLEICNKKDFLTAININQEICYNFKII